MVRTFRARPLALLCCGALTAQSALFDDLVSTCGPADASRAKQAVRAFLRIDDGQDRAKRLEWATRCAYWCGDHALCVRLGDEAQRIGRSSDASDEARLRSLLVTKSFPSLLVSAKAAAAPVLVAVLQTMEGECAAAADALMRSGDLEGGLWIFERIATSLAPSAPRLCNWGLALRHSGQLERALGAYQQALEVAPGDPWTWNDYGLLLRILGRVRESRAAFLRSLALDARTGDGPAITNLALEAVLSPVTDAECDEAIQLAKAALGNRPDAALLRRAMIDLALARQQVHGETAPDKSDPGR